MENKSHAMAAGIFVLVLAALLAGLALWLTRDRQTYTEFELSTPDTISGLQNQATVRYKGVAVGKVTGINFDESAPGNVLIRIAVDSKAPVTPTGTYATLGYQGVTGIAHIQLDDLHPPLAQPLPDVERGIPRLLVKNSQLNELADQGLNILVRVDDATKRITELLSAENQKNFGTLLENLAAAAGSVNELTRTLNTTMHNQLVPALKQFPALAEDAQKTMRSMERVGDNASALVNDVHQMTQNIQAPGGALQQLTDGAQAMVRVADRLDRATLPSISQAANDVSSAAQQMGSAASGIGNNPQALIFGVRGAPGPGEPGFVAPEPIR